MRPAFDIVFILGSYRRSASFLPLIKELSPHLRVGLLGVPLHANCAKNTPAESAFRALAHRLGGESVGDGPVETRLAVFPPDQYPEEAIALIKSRLKAERRVAFLELAPTRPILEFVFRFEIETLMVVSKRFFEFRVRDYPERAHLSSMRVIEVGLPYFKYPLFPEFKCDYLVAMPTPFSFPTAAAKLTFLETLLQLFAAIPSSETIIYKQHNALKTEIFVKPRHRVLSILSAPLPLGLFRALAKALPKNWHRLRLEVEGLLIGILHRQAMRRMAPLSSLTPYSEMAFEAFLPGVRKGVIGGLSNTVWGALFARKPFFNCVQSRDGNEPTLYKKDASDLLLKNLQFFSVPYCESKLEFNPELFDQVDDGCRQGDFVAALKEILSEKSSAPTSSIGDERTIGSLAPVSSTVC